ncbi:activating signal cointegrator 1 complex subunit 2 homolog [Lytechinus pictus]|uniref:activating signal cointegrator 1 complex subunit 2 homolog n=1 Tax=Lytechinus pictus TaxID=7653 RepID=UPI0030BA15F6
MRMLYNKTVPRVQLKNEKQIAFSKKRTCSINNDVLSAFLLCSTSPAGGAIDNKIEQAMDLVKSHLLFAVREEVEVLKEQIKILVEKNDLLQEENTTLKKRLQASTAPSQGNPNPGMAIAAAPHQGMPIQPPAQEQQQYPNMPNQMGQNLGQNTMGQALSDHAAYPQHPRPTQQTHSTPNPGGLPDSNPQYTPQTGAHSQLHIQTGQTQQQQQSQQPPQQQQHLSQGMQQQEIPQYSQVAATAPQQQAQSQATPQQYHTPMTPGAVGNRPNTTH